MKNTMLAGACVAVVAALATAPAEARMSKAEVARALEQTYPVRVLAKYTKAAQFDGKPVYEVKVMNAGGDFNAAFMITTLVVDADTGKLLSVFRHRESGYVQADAGARIPNRQSPDALRGIPWR